VFIEPVPNLRHRCTLIVAFENVKDKRSRQRVRLKMLVAVDHIADGTCTAVVLAFQRVVRHAANDLFGQIGRVVFGVTLQYGFQNDALRTVGNHLSGGHDLHSVFLQQGFVPRTVVSVAGKAIQLPDDDHVEQLFAAVFNHVLKFRAIVGLGRKGAVDVVPQNCDAVLFCECRAFPELAFNRFLPLVVGGIAGIDYSSHLLSPPSGNAFTLGLSMRDSII
jgi:hypothetical protein